MRKGLAHVPVVLIFLFSVELLELSALELAGANTGMVGASPSLDGDIIAFRTSESLADEDLNGDGSIEPISVIRYYRISTGEVTNTGAEGLSPSLDGDIIAFETYEAREGVNEDLNLDGDKLDDVIRYYDIGTDKLTNTRTVGSSPSVDGDTIAFRTYEGQLGTDLNADGDKEDNVIRYYNISTGIVMNTWTSGVLPSLDGSIIAFTTWEEEAGLDLNGDGDIDDPVIRYYDLGTGTVTNTGLVGWSPSLDGNIIALSTSEAEAGIDLNGDGDTIDQLIRYYDISTGTVTNAGVEGFAPSIEGDIVAFVRWREDLGLSETGYCDLSTGTVSWGIIGGSPSVSGNTIAFHLGELNADMDLNGDGDKRDIWVIFYFQIGVHEPMEIESGPPWNLILIVAAALVAAAALLIAIKRR